MKWNVKGLLRPWLSWLFCLPHLHLLVDSLCLWMNSPIIFAFPSPFTSETMGTLPSLILQVKLSSTRPHMSLPPQSTRLHQPWITSNPQWVPSLGSILPPAIQTQNPCPFPFLAAKARILSPFFSEFKIPWPSKKLKVPFKEDNTS